MLCRVLHKPKQKTSCGYQKFPFSVCDLVSSTKPGRVFMKFRTGVLIKKCAGNESYERTGSMTDTTQVFSQA
jgi:hypothetical protein